MSSTPQPSTFFSPWEPPPPFAHPPPDPALAQRIVKLVEFAVRNGPSFVDLARQKQAGNPEYGFLTGGDGAAFFTWRLFAAVNHLPADQPLPAGQHAALAAPAAPQPGAVGAVSSSPSPALPPEVASGWAQVLAALSGSHTSIRASQEWFMACRQHAQGMAEMMLQASKATQEAAKQLHLLYLANDVLFKALPSRPTGSTPEADAVAEAFCPRLGTMLRHAFLAGGQTDEAQAPLLKMVNHWAEKRIYNQATIERMTMELLGLVPEPGPAAAAPSPAAAPVPAGSAPQPTVPWANRPPVPPGLPPVAAQPPAPGYLGAHPPPMWAAEAAAPAHHPGVPWGHAGAAPAAHVPPQAQAAPLAEPEPPGFDPMSFPPGLIPKLVEESLKVDPPYSPLTIRAVSEAGVPPPPQVDAYLSARLDKFYAQIADYRPGMQFVDLETEPPRRRTFVDRGTEERVHRTTVEPFDDGSGPRGSRGSGGAQGLGYGGAEPAEPSEQKVDVFNKYRSMLSGAYFEQIHRSLAKRGG
ncbi:hypothetical protein ACKKBF_B31580 [Auxenochlorella protothecoides x Auxenochlorella symbiontica]